MDVTTGLAVMSGVALAAACGLRAFLPVLVVGVAARFGWIALGPSYAWLHSDPALIALAVAAVLEIAGDKIPVVDHALDVAGSVLRPIAAAVAMLGVLPHLPGPVAALLAIASGLGAFGVHALKAKTRIGSSALTLGHANPFLSVAEDGATLTISAAAVVVPAIAFAFIVLLLWLSVRRRMTTRAG
ncbi:MAG: DUF4126 domain-containing protein [Candidatus Eisenbacteria bacterium]|nr:DUF4126 domain-containing protein [Candidatus Eisenbacteria bacterium]